MADLAAQAAAPKVRWRAAAAFFGDSSVSLIKPLPEAVVSRFRSGMKRAVDRGLPEPTAMTLATVGVHGRPSARTVLLKGMDAQGFVFYTNLTSRKGRHIKNSPDVSLVWWWLEDGEKVLVAGKAQAVEDHDDDC